MTDLYDRDTVRAALVEAVADGDRGRADRSDEDYADRILADLPTAPEARTSLPATCGACGWVSEWFDKDVCGWTDAAGADGAGVIDRAEPPPGRCPLRHHPIALVRTPATKEP